MFIPKKFKVIGYPEEAYNKDGLYYIVKEINEVAKPVIEKEILRCFKETYYGQDIFTGGRAHLSCYPVLVENSKVHEMTTQYMDGCYADKINPIRVLEGRGVVIWGQQVKQDFFKDSIHLPHYCTLMSLFDFLLWKKEERDEDIDLGNNPGDVTARFILECETYLNRELATRKFHRASFDRQHNVIELYFHPTADCFRLHVPHQMEEVIAYHKYLKELLF